MGKGKTDAEKKPINTVRMAQPIGTFNCPTRRESKAYPNSIQMANADPATQVVRLDYAGNHGTTSYVVHGASYAEPPDERDGIFFERSITTIQQIKDGATNTMLLGEKYINPNNYFTGSDGADNENAYVGNDNDTNRTTFAPPLQDTRNATLYDCFGSAHAAALNISLCDGSVRAVSYGVDGDVWKKIGSRIDGETVNFGKL
jgi:hypothetical protein